MSKVRQRFKKGDRVRDRFKLPKPTDPGTTGTVVSVRTVSGGLGVALVTVDWDTPGPFQPLRQDVHAGLLELVTEQKERGQA